MIGVKQGGGLAHVLCNITLEDDLKTNLNYGKIFKDSVGVFTDVIGFKNVTPSCV